MKRHLTAALSKAITSAYPQLPATTTANVNLSKTPNVDYSDTSALKLAKSLQSSPLEIATNIISHLPPTLSGPSGLFETIESTDKGFLNISVGDAWLSRELRAIAIGATSKPVVNNSPDRVIVDFASQPIAIAPLPANPPQRLSDDRSAPVLTTSLSPCALQVMFQSDLFHASQPFHFRADSFADRRINLTYLFGLKEGTTNLVHIMAPHVGEVCFRLLRVLRYLLR